MWVQRISEYGGKLLNHFEATYRPGERQLAQEFLVALGLEINDFGFSTPEATQMMGIHFEAADRDPTNNIIFLHQMSEPQAEFDAVLRDRLANDPELAAAQAKFLERVEKYPGGTPHFGIRYQSMAELDQTIERLEATGGDLQSRVKVMEMPPY